MKTIAVFCLLVMVVYCWGCAAPSRSSNPYEIGGLPKEDTQAEILAIVVVVGLGFLLAYAIDEAGKKRTAAMESWIGAPVTRLILSWGPPQRVVSDGGDGKIYIWTEPVDIELVPGSIKREGTYGHGRYSEEIRVEPPVDIKYNRVRMFWVNSRGIIYHGKWKGL